MARHTNNIAFKNAQLTFNEDGTILITEFGKDFTETHDLTNWLHSFDGEDRFINVTIQEVTSVEGQGE